VTERRALRRGAYLATAAGLAVAGWAAAAAGGAAAAEAAIGLVLAWSVQAASFWPLAGSLAAGRPATTAWVGGMTARVGGLALLWALSALSGGRGRTVVLAYAFALVAYLVLEAAWLAVAARGDRTGNGTA
jgi:hypothetical protein